MSKFFKFPGKEDGFTLIEVVAVVSILAIVLIPSFIMFYEGIRYVGTSKLRNQAISLAEEKMEEIRNRNYTEIPLGTWYSGQGESINGGAFYRQVSVVIPSGSAFSGEDPLNPSIKEITVTVSWTDAIGSKSVRLVTYRTRQL